MKAVFFAAFLFASLASQRAEAQFTLSCDSFCISNIEMDTATPGYLAVTLFNHNAGHVNYPTLRVLDTNGNWLAGDSLPNFFAHMGHAPQTYVIPTSLDSVPVGFTATVILSEGIWDTVCVLPFPCVDVVDNVEDKFSSTVRVYPVPADNALVVNTGNGTFEFSMHDATGRRIMRGTADGAAQIDLTHVPNGVYWLRVANRRAVVVEKIIVQHR